MRLNVRWRSGSSAYIILALLMPAAAVVMQWMKTLQEFPPRQKPASFSVGDVMAKLEANHQALAAASK